MSSISNLYEASYSGCVSTLNTLFQKEPYILCTISRTAFSETPLHVSASLGHLDFTKRLLTLKPKLAEELDSFRCTPLHLASAEGQKETVRELLQVYDEACLKRDADGRIPLHYAAMRGRTEVVKELIAAKPESLSELDEGKTVLHLCVTYNQLEALKALVEEHVDRMSEFLNFKDSDGDNTILHMAVMLKQVETIRYLLSIDIIKGEANNNKNKMGLTAIEMIEHSSKDFKILEIQLLFVDAGIKVERKQQGTHLQPPTSSTTRTQRHCWNKFLKGLKNLMYHKSDWLEETRQTLSVVSTVIATMTFQTAMNPPGGVVQLGSPSVGLDAAIPSDAYDEYIQNYYKLINSTQSPSSAPAPASSHKQQEFYPCFYLNNKRRVCPGQAVLAYTDRSSYLAFYIFNTIAFIASLSVTMLLISGIPLKHRFSMWLLSIGMCITLTFLALTYLFGAILVNPDHVLPLVGDVFGLCYLTWFGLLLLVAAFIAARFLMWAVKLCRNRCKPKSQMPSTPAI